MLVLNAEFQHALLVWMIMSIYSSVWIVQVSNLNQKPRAHDCVLIPIAQDKQIICVNSFTSVSINILLSLICQATVQLVTAAGVVLYL